MTDHSMMKLGCIRSAPDPRIPALADVWKVPTEVPDTVDWYSRVPADWGMMGNDQVGDCTAAAISHAIEQWTAYTDPTPVVMSTDQVISAYSAVSGYVPGDPATDRGALCADVLRYWATTGMLTPDGGPDTLTGAASVDPRDLDAVGHALGALECDA